MRLGLQGGGDREVKVDKKQSSALGVSDQPTIRLEGANEARFHLDKQHRGIRRKIYQFSYPSSGLLHIPRSAEPLHPVITDQPHIDRRKSTNIKRSYHVIFQNS